MPSPLLHHIRVPVAPDQKQGPSGSHPRRAFIIPVYAGAPYSSLPSTIRSRPPETPPVLNRPSVQTTIV